MNMPEDLFSTACYEGDISTARLVSTFYSLPPEVLEEGRTLLREKVLALDSTRIIDSPCDE